MARHAGTGPVAAASAAALAIAVPAPSALADNIHETGDPFGGPFGVLGYDVFENQSVGARFTVAGKNNFTLDRLRLWLWNNDETGGQPLITITVRTDHFDGGISTPSEEILETWTFDVPTTGPNNPILFEFQSVDQPLLEAGQKYWVVGESDAAATLDPVWALAAEETGFYSTTDFFTGEWTPAVDGPVPAMIVEGTPVGAGVPGDINGDGSVSTEDLLLLLAAWGKCPGPAGECPADLDGDGTVSTADLLILLSNWG
jgi:hypothetical protein